LLTISLAFLPTIVEDFKKLKKENIKTSYKNWLWGLLIMYVSNILIITLTKDIASNESYNRNLLYDMPIYAITVMVFVAPLIEELIFRLSLKDIFRNKWVYATFSGLVFGLMHMTTIKNPLELLYVISYGSLGFFFAKSVYETDNIWSSMITHMSHNGAIITLLLLTNAIGA
jgi:membrane protease YdiL (CAAX protease family)